MLELEKIVVNYGRLAALRGVSIQLRQGEVVCIVGPNGAGKSTMLAAIASGVKLKAGTIRLDGKAITGIPPEEIARLGVSFVPEGRMVFGTLTVAENLRVASLQRKDRGQIKRDFERVLDIFPRLRERLRELAGRLSGGEQQMLVIGRALMTRPRLIMIDEPSLGLAPRIIDQVYEVLLSLRQEGVTLLINEQSSERVLQFADRIYVLVNGQIRLQGEAAKLRDGEAIFKAYFGFDRVSQKPATRALADGVAS